MRLNSIRSNSYNKSIIRNIFGTFLFKGGAVLINMICIPLYLRYFNDNEVLGIWFTIINVLNWLLTFDLGIGNGLRNNLTKALAEKNSIKAKELISSAYIMLGGVVLFATILFFGFSGFINWNSFFNIEKSILPELVLVRCINITMAGILASFLLRLVIAINYALQKSALNNLIGLISSILTLGYLLTIEPAESVIQNFVSLSVFQAIAVNIPLLIATIIAFNHSQLKNARPSFKSYNKKSAKNVLSLGLIFLYVQLLYMVITVTNEWFITKFYNARYCVDYQIYYKLFSLIGMVFMLMLTPIWSAITKAYAEKRFTWIIQLHKVLYLSVGIVSLVQIIIIPIMPLIMKIWLGDNAIAIDNVTMWIFVSFSIIYIWNAVQSVIVAGLGDLKLQAWGYTFAALFKIFAIVLFAKYFNWSWVIVVTCIGLLPYSIIQPIYIYRHLSKLKRQVAHP